MGRRVSFVKREVYHYPGKEDLFRPFAGYAEDPFPEDASKKENDVYDMVREVLHRFGLDEEHYGQPEWNPLRDYVSPGSRVLIKPNMVLDRNYSGEGEDCLYTHPSLVAAMIDYVWIALQGKGTIVVGDAPLQECVFENLIEKSGYEEMIRYYQGKGLDIRLMDFRNIRSEIHDGVNYAQHPGEHRDNGRIVQLNEESAFAEFDDAYFEKFRVTNYDSRILQKHHHDKVHEYMIAQEVLLADTIINMPKPKTHRKAGVTSALKNLVGINANKEFLPHHRYGSKEEGGDAYQHKNDHLTKASDYLDEKDALVEEHQMEEAKKKWVQCREEYRIGRGIAEERYWDGSWYGNDTIWRSISDLNKILFYADKNGTICHEKQRKYFIVGDMIVSGQKEGPLHPSPIETGTIVAGDNPVMFDRAVCAVMGFDYHKIPSLCGTTLAEGKCRLEKEGEPEVIANCAEWDGKSLDNIREHASLGFQPTAGWEEVLGNPKKEAFFRQLEEENMPIIIFGAGVYGTDALFYAHNQGINLDVRGFFDNDPEKWGQVITGELLCRKPEYVGEEYICLISAAKVYEDALKESAEKCGFKKVYCWRM